MSLEVVLRHIRRLDVSLYDRLVKAVAEQIETRLLFVGLSFLCEVMSWSFSDLKSWLHASKTQVWTCPERRSLEKFLVQFDVLRLAGIDAEGLLRQLCDRSETYLGVSYSFPMANDPSPGLVVMSPCGSAESVPRGAVVHVDADGIQEKDVWICPGTAGTMDNSPPGGAGHFLSVGIDTTLLCREPELATAVVDRLVDDTCADRVLLLQSALKWLEESGIVICRSSLPLKELPRRSPVWRRDEEPLVVCRLIDLGNEWRDACRAVLMNAAGEGQMDAAPGQDWPVRTDAQTFRWSGDTVCVIAFPDGIKHVPINAEQVREMWQGKSDFVDHG